jgi:hypothetical protein
LVQERDEDDEEGDADGAPLTDDATAVVAEEAAEVEEVDVEGDELGAPGGDDAPGD